MILRILGSGSAEGTPAFYSNTRVNEYARKVGGREIRTRSGALIDGVLKIDFGPDTLLHIQRDHLDPREWEALVFTHSHDDHCCLSQLQYMMFPFNENEYFPFPIYGNCQLAQKIRDVYPEWPIEIHETKSFEPYQASDYVITPIHAHHMLEEDAHNLIIEKDGRRLLYATDTGLWLDKSWEFLRDQRLHCVVLECTEGKNKTDYFGHLSLPTAITVIKRLRDWGTLIEGGLAITTHHSHSGDLTYAEYVEALTPHNILAGYDGLEVEI